MILQCDMQEALADVKSLANRSHQEIATAYESLLTAVNAAKAACMCMYCIVVIKYHVVAGDVEGCIRSLPDANNEAEIKVWYCKCC